MHISKPLQQPTGTPVSHSSSVEPPVQKHSPCDARLLVTTPRAQALTILSRALGHGEILTIGHTTLRHLEQGEQFEEGDSCFEALQDGIYQRLAVYLHGQPLDGPPSHHTWGYGMGLGQAYHWIGTLYDALPPYEQEILVVGITTRHVLRTLRTSRGTRPLANARDVTTEIPFI